MDEEKGGKLIYASLFTQNSQVLLADSSSHGHRRRQWHPTPALLPGKSMDGGAWWAAVHGVAKSQGRLSDFTFAFHFHALEKEMATHSSVLAWRIPETVGPRLWGHTESDTTEAA